MRPEPESDLDKKCISKLDSCLRLLRQGVTMSIALKRNGLLDFIKQQTPLAVWFNEQMDSLSEELTVVAESKLLHLLHHSEDARVVAQVALGIRQDYMKNEQFKLQHGLNKASTEQVAVFNSEVVSLLKAVLANGQNPGTVINLALSIPQKNPTIEDVITVVAKPLEDTNNKKNLITDNVEFLVETLEDKKQLISIDPDLEDLL